MFMIEVVPVEDPEAVIRRTHGRVTEFLGKIAALSEEDPTQDQAMKLEIAKGNLTSLKKHLEYFLDCPPLHYPVGMSLVQIFTRTPPEHRLTLAAGYAKQVAEYRPEEEPIH